MALVLEGISFGFNPLASAEATLQGMSIEDTPLEVGVMLQGINIQDHESISAPFNLKGVNFQDLPCFEDKVLIVDDNVTESIIYCNLRNICDEFIEPELLGHVLYKDILIKAGGFPSALDPRWAADCSQRFNQTKCAADSEFIQPVVNGDILFFQWQFDDTLNTIAPGGLTYGWDTGIPGDFLMAGEIEDECSAATVDINTVSVEDYVGIRAVSNPDGSTSYEPVQGLKIDTSLIPYTCFRIKVRKFNDIPNTQFEELCSEPYKKIDCEGTFTLQSDYKGKDTFGQDYSEPFEVSPGSESFGHSNFVRVPGSIQLEDINHTKVTINNTTREISSQECLGYRARTFLLPEYFVRIISNVINGPDIRLDGTIMRYEGPMEKDLEQGTMWMTEMNFNDCSSSVDFDCET